MKNIVFGILLAMGIGHLYAETLTVQVENAVIGKGHLMVGLFNNKESFPSNQFRGVRIEVSDTVMTVVFEDLPPGEYVVSVYQDANDNEKLDKTIFGIPTERYGFSNDRRLPNYKNCVFVLYDGMTIPIRIR
jgi:uncharacterized protein (DUF2141 family)